MLRLYLVRHGETKWNVERRMQGWQDSPLTENGIEQAKRIGAFFQQKEKLDRIYVSPSGRTIHTAAEIAAAAFSNIYQDSRLQEINLGIWEGLTSDQVNKQDYVESNRFWEKPEAYQATNGGETFTDLQKRVKSFLADLVTTHTSGTILAVTHAVVIKMILMLVRENQLAHLWEPPFINCGSLNLLECTNKWRIVFAGKTVTGSENR